MLHQGIPQWWNRLVCYRPCISNLSEQSWIITGIAHNYRNTVSSFHSHSHIGSVMQNQPFSCDECGNFLYRYFIVHIFFSQGFFTPVLHICINEYSRVDHEFRIFKKVSEKCKVNNWSLIEILNTTYYLEGIHVRIYESQIPCESVWQPSRHVPGVSFFMHFYGFSTMIS